MLMNEHFDNCYFFLNLLQGKLFRKKQIIMTLYIQEKATVNGKRYVELCYPQ